MHIPFSAHSELSKLRIAIVHNCFLERGEGEQVVEALAEVFPQADLFSLVADRSTLAPVLQKRKLRTSFLQPIPGAVKFHRHFLFLQPIASVVTLKPATHGRLKTGHALVPDRFCFTLPK